MVIIFFFSFFSMQHCFIENPLVILHSLSVFPGCNFACFELRLPFNVFRSTFPFYLGYKKMLHSKYYVWVMLQQNGICIALYVLYFKNKLGLLDVIRLNKSCIISKIHGCLMSVTIVWAIDPFNNFWKIFFIKWKHHSLINNKLNWKLIH